jgi:hypothetical protein
MALDLPRRATAESSLKLERSNCLTTLLKKGNDQMSNEPTPLRGVMEGQGAYNKFAKLPASGAVFALSLLEKAIRSLELDAGDQPITIADYGSSQGKNSLVPMKIAIEGLRRRLGPDRAISVFHIDQPMNANRDTTDKRRWRDKATRAAPPCAHYRLCYAGSPTGECRRRGG